MNISDTNQDFASLQSRIEILEAEQSLCKQKVIWLKRYIDEFKKEFNTRPELEQIESLQHATSELSTHVDNLQQRNSLDNGDTNASSDQGKPVSVEEFLSLYNAGQRDFTGINLVGVLNTLKVLIEYDEGS